MEERILYKYLDAEGGLKMLQNHNLMFTNATQLNDPFECHQNLIDFSGSTNPRIFDFIRGRLRFQEEEWCKAARDKTWGCSLSKVFDSTLMWAFYGNNHQGICIGIDFIKAMHHIGRIESSYKTWFEVQYTDIRNRPEYYHDKTRNYLLYQFATKAEEWAYEKEVRFVVINPSSKHMSFLSEREETQFSGGMSEKSGGPGCSVKNTFKESTNKATTQDCRQARFFVDLGGECFDSLYFGTNVESYKREIIKEFAKNVNPNIKIYQMTQGPEAFRLKEEMIEK